MVLFFLAFLTFSKRVLGFVSRFFAIFFQNKENASDYHLVRSLGVEYHSKRIWIGPNVFLLSTSLFLFCCVWLKLFVCSIVSRIIMFFYQRPYFMLHAPWYKSASLINEAAVSFGRSSTGILWCFFGMAVNVISKYFSSLSKREISKYWYPGYRTLTRTITIRLKTHNIFHYKSHL